MVASASLRPVSFVDGLGERVAIVESAAGDILEALQFADELSASGGFEQALRDRVARLADFRHQNYARIWRVEGGAGTGTALALVTERPRAMRLADMLEALEEGRSRYDYHAMRSLIEQIVSAVASLHLVGPDVAHGTLGPERLMVTPHGQLVVVEHVLGPALEHLELNRAQLWRDYRVAIPPAAGVPRFDQRADALQIGMLALALMLGRRLREEEFPGQLAELVDLACRGEAGEGRRPLSRAFGVWMIRALQFDVRHSFQSARDAKAGLDSVLQDEPRSGAFRVPAVPSPSPVAVAPLAARTTLVEVSPPPRIDSPPRVESPRVRDPGLTLLAGLDRDGFSFGDLAASWGHKVGVVAGTLWRPIEIAAQVASALWRPVIVVASVALVVGVASLAIPRYADLHIFGLNESQLTIDSRFTGAEVWIDGQPHGRAPTTITLTPGPHTIELRPAPRLRPMTRPAAEALRPPPKANVPVKDPET